MVKSVPTVVAPAKNALLKVEELSIPFNSGAIVLQPDQLAVAEAALAKLDFGSMGAGDVIKLGLPAEQSLQRTLDGFLSKLDRNTAAKLFDLFGRLEKGVEDANLDEVLTQVQNGTQPGFFQSLWGKLTGKSRDDLVRDLMSKVNELVSGRTRSLSDEMSRLETQLNGEMQKLFEELKSLHALKKSYSGHFKDFTTEAAVARAFLDKAKAFVEREATSMQPGDAVAQARLVEFKDKLRLLESRALALEGTYTRLPTDQLVIQQIEQAGVATLQETATTVASRFASIKMTLLSIHGAFAVKNVQQIGERQAKMDEQLTRIREKTLKDVAVSAAKAPGENRLAQAKQIEQIVVSTREIHGLIAAAKQETEAKFGEARERFAAARRELATLQTP